MISFLDLPREIRDEIYAASLTDPLPPPSSLRTLHQNRQSPNNNHHTMCNRYSLQPPPISSAALLLTNHQIHTEVQDTLSRLRASNHLRYKLDVVVENETYMYPTWTCIPTLSPHVDVVEADFRISGVRPKGCHRFQGGDGGPPYVTWSLLSLITDFLIAGPHPAAVATAKRQHIPHRTPVTSIGTISIRVVSSPEAWTKGKAIIPPPDVDSWSSDVGMMMHAETLLSYIWWNMRILMGLGRKEAAEYCPHAEMVFARVGMIEVGMAGAETTKWDVKEMARSRGD